MNRDKRILGVIPARGGSKGVPRKNVRLVGGKPLIAWTLEAASRSKYLDRTIVSSDDDEIIEVVRALGGDVPFRRPSEFARDSSTHSDVLFHAIEQIPGYSHVVLLNPTAPLRTEDDIDGCIDLCLGSSAPACVTVCPTGKPPEWTFRVDDQGRMFSVMGLKELPLLRQDVPEAYMLNGAVMIAETDWYLNAQSFFSSETLAYKMPAARSVDLDTELDFMLLEQILRLRESASGR